MSESDISNEQALEKWARRTLGPVSEIMRHRLVSYDPARKVARSEFFARPEFLNPAGQVQGGFIAAMMDEAVTDVILIETDYAFYAPTLTLQVQYLRPAMGARFISEARVQRRGRNSAFLAATLYDEAGVELATAQSTVQLVPTQVMSDLRQSAPAKE